MSIHVCKCVHNEREEFHLRYPGMSEEAAQSLADRINAGMPTQQDLAVWPDDMLERIDSAINRIASGHGLMRVPPDKTDPDIVLADIYKLIKSSRTQAREPLPKGEWPKHPSTYVNGVYMGYAKSDLDDYAMQVLAAHGVKEGGAA